MLLETLGADLWLGQEDTGVRRRARWHRRKQVQRLAAADCERNVLTPVTYCGRSLNADVDIRIHRGRAFASGLVACGKIWTCPTCSVKIRARRQAELAQAAAVHVAKGGTLAMLTLTVRHKREMTLDETLGALSESWRVLTNRTAWRKLRVLTEGYVRAVEVTHGSNGWHPHDHVLLFLKPGVSDVQASAFSSSLFAAWSATALKVLKVAPTMERGLDFVFFGVDSDAAAAYITKASKELTFADSKSGRDPFALLDDCSPASAALFWEYATATHRKKAISWSKGLREYGGLLSFEKTDEELAQEDNKVGVVVATMAAALWNSLDVQDRLHWLEFFECRYSLFGSSP